MAGWSARGIAEAIGAIGVMGSLIFVGLEVRQNSTATRAATNAAVADTYRQMNALIASSPELAQAMVAMGESPEEASDVDKVLVLGLWRGIFHSWQNVHRQWTDQTLDRALYESPIRKKSTNGPLGLEERKAPVRHRLREFRRFDL
jgi:hypothetical protein